jgi:AcrR family transcriptional regulator
VAHIRRTQAERTAATRAALLTATVDALVENGYRNTATQAVAKRAGVSYGALLHHFPTKADLLSAAVRHLFDQRIAEFRKAMADIPPDVPKVDAAIDTLWAMFQGPTFTAWLELWVAARTDPELAGAVSRVDQQFVDTSTDIFRELFAEETAEDPDLPRLAIGMTFTFLDGLALSHHFPGYEPYDSDELLGVFKLLVSSAMPTDPRQSERAHR